MEQASEKPGKIPIMPILLPFWPRFSITSKVAVPELQFWNSLCYISYNWRVYEKDIVFGIFFNSYICYKNTLYFLAILKIGQAFALEGESALSFLRDRSMEEWPDEAEGSDGLVGIDSYGAVGRA
ncbi:MAG: hypothetical protein LBD58_05485 [Treponema sp.]|nr:hypothetical protein [Treponema sp.]